MTRTGENGKDRRRSRSKSNSPERKKKRSRSHDRSKSGASRSSANNGSANASGMGSISGSGGTSSSSSSSAARRERHREEHRERERELWEREKERDRELEKEREKEAARKREREKEREKLREQATKYAQSVSSSGKQSKFDQMPPGMMAPPPLLPPTVVVVEKLAEEKKVFRERPKEEVYEVPVAPMDKEEEQRRLEQEMTKRRERIERWRAERNKKEQEIKKPLPTIVPVSVSGAKKWSLEDDEEDDETEDAKDKADGAAEEEEEIDPLDAFMKEVNEEVRKVNKLSNPLPKTDGKASSSGVTIITGVAKQKQETKKGELIEQNQDGLEYSSEEEQEDIKDTAANLANKQKKELAKIDHSGINYMPFRKSFYVEVPEIARMTQTEIDAYKKELEGIAVKGKGCPKPIKTWAHCGVSRKEFEVLRKLGFEKPTPIQCQAIPAIMSGRDLIGIAKTGSGKTLAFILPMFRHLLDQPPLEDGDGPIAIIMTPTRELCMQIGKDIKKFSKSLNLRTACVYGGTGISEQIAELKRGAEIIVCTPGRMIDMLAANSGRVTNLRRVTYVVLDEADRMFDMGFEPQVMRIIDNVRPDRQTVMFSATFPRQMEALARRILKKPIEVQVGGRSVVCKDVEQHVVVLDDEAKFFKLLELLGIYQEQGSIIVFVDKQENADSLLKDLMKASYPCMSLHGGIDQFDRDSTMVDFKQGRVKLLIATSVAARGLDVKQLILVVNYDCPNHYEDYVHRCGRTGRAGAKGFAWTFLTPEQGRYSGDIIRALELSGGTVPEDLRNLWDTYKAAQEAEGKKVHTGGGFSGKGFKFDAQEAAAVNERKKMQKAALGLQDSDDEEDLEQDIDQQIENMFATKRIVKEVEPPASNKHEQQNNPPPAPAPPVPSVTHSDKLELAKRLASKINLQKTLGTDSKGATQQAAEAILKGANTQQLIAAKTVAEQLAAKLNNKLNYQPKDEEEPVVETNEQVFRKYEEELEINDFPQQARWKVTSKEALAQISEYSEAGLTVRGTYVPPGKNPPDGERKLYLAIESCNELAVTKAKREITRLIKEELLKLQASSHHVINKARYKVV
ncbi:probable ATP-dependent RNA helicase DDX46 isoform X1 [Anopheles arabiensis]|uniref:Probable ATP-dependent RNA helicase DDX46 n=2 Tax=Anopheles arabiensis TaxID=7173 RepID=A0A182I641_ANOAR|nr:probable ATP-dependent RNA helicase DDX46 isoform X1 [Anopheles arabiensis]